MSLGSSKEPVLVDIIIPVYKNVDVTRRCVNAVLRSYSSAIGSIIVIDDASPEQDVVDYCNSLAGDERITVLHNEENMGFVVTVNKGMSFSKENDVVLLNSDAEVNGNWLERLQYCAYSADDVATATPFSNNATICSYPIFIKENEIPPGFDLAQIDDLFAANNAKLNIEVPTGVGFCMYIRRAALDKVGLFDVANFGRGYGEECDFSLRASKAGFRNLLCADTYVYHQGGVSFDEETKSRIVMAEGVMDKIHPEYKLLVAKFVSKDPLRELRDRIDYQRSKISHDNALQLADELRTYRDKLVSDTAEYRGYIDNTLDLLERTRAEFIHTDEGLAQAQQLVNDHIEALKERDLAIEGLRLEKSDLKQSLAVVNTESNILKSELNTCYINAEEMQNKLQLSGDLAHSLDDELTQIKNSLIWRYSQKLKNLLSRS